MIVGVEYGFSELYQRFKRWVSLKIWIVSRIPPPFLCTFTQGLLLKDVLKTKDATLRRRLTTGLRGTIYDIKDVEELPDARLGRSEEIFGSPVKSHSSFIKEDNLIGNFLGKRHIVSHHN